MTRDDVLAAHGRALDHEVHLHVFGRDESRLLVPDYSAGWPEAAMVIEHMVHRPGGWLPFIKLAPHCGAYSVVFSRPFQPEINGNWSDREIGVAVCKAALLAILADGREVRP